LPSSEDEEDELDSEKIKKILKSGKRPDFIVEGVSGYQSTDKNIKKRLHFEYLVGEVARSPLKQSKKKTESNKYKLFKLMKDNHNSIVSYLYNKYGQNMDYSDVNDLEIYGILVSGFQLYIYVLDQPGSSINRIRLIETLMLPVDKEDSNYYIWIDRLVYALNRNANLLEKLIRKKRTILEEIKTFY